MKLHSNYENKQICGQLNQENQSISNTCDDTTFFKRDYPLFYKRSQIHDD